MATYSVRFVVREIPDGEYINADNLEAAISDIFDKAVMPALQLEVLPLTLEVKKSRKR